MIKINQPTFETVKHQQFDVMIVASGFESRAAFQTNLISSLPPIKYVLLFDSETDDPVRKKNDALFTEIGFRAVVVQSETTLLELVESIFTEGQNKIMVNNILRIYIDYSSMTRNWYSTILFALSNKANKIRINVSFGYSHANFISSMKLEVFNRIVEPLFGYCNLSIPVKPTALMICLGNEKNRAYGLQEYFDAETYFYYSDTSNNNQYSVEVETVNKEILNNNKPDNIFRFPIHDLIQTNFLIENLCKVLMIDYRVIIAPCGPKPFTLLALINALKYIPDIEVWRISPGIALPKIDRTPNGLISVLEVNFTE